MTSMDPKEPLTPLLLGVNSVRSSLGPWSNTRRGVCAQNTCTDVKSDGCEPKRKQEVTAEQK